jgi:hypothetical protein
MSAVSPRLNVAPAAATAVRPATNIGCTYAAVAAAVAKGGVYDFDCSGTIYVTSQLVVPKGRDVTLSGAGHSVTLEAGLRGPTPNSRIFSVTGTLSLADLTLTAELQTDAGSNGYDGFNGKTGSTGSSGPPGGNGSAGGAGGNAQWGGRGSSVTDDAVGGAIYIYGGSVAVNGCHFTNDHVIAGNGGNGGNGGQGGDGG